MNRMEVPMKTFTAVIEKCSETGLYVGYVPGLCNPAMANSASEGSRTAVRRIANSCPGDGEQSERSDAVSKKHLRKPSLSQFRLFFSHGLPREFELIGIMNEPIEDGVCQGRIGNNLVPVFHRKLACNQR